MRTLISVAAALVVCVAMFLLPHHMRDPKKSPMGPFTLLDNLRDMLETMNDLHSPRAAVFAMISLASIVLVFWPVLLVLIVRMTNGQPGMVTAPLLLMGGIATIIAAAFNFLVMLMSQTSIGFGGGHSTAKPTVLIWIVPLIQVVSGVTAAVAAFSPKVLAAALAILV